MRIATKHISNTITLLWLLSLYSVFGQDSTTVPSTSSFVTIHVSGGLSEFTRESSTLATNRFDQAGMRAWRAGLTIGMINSRFYQMRLELGYVGRGASERFAMGNSIINSDIKLNLFTGHLTAISFQV